MHDGLYVVLLWAGMEVYRVAIWAQEAILFCLLTTRYYNSAKNTFHE